MVFADSWGWVAWAFGRDESHSRVVAISDSVRKARGRFVTSNFVLSESLTPLRYDESLTAALSLLERVATMVQGRLLEVVTVDDALWAAAVDWFRRYDDQHFSFVDCTSFAIMAERGLTEALTADRHFATAGFVPLGA
ncbi:MAG: type II toxin-antitoxin system VapC family toxin [Armatimonadetes bacterium]|nr:type II toxin-antitoxin system VapC family toxin [Armatimonadota bacterium]